jgi:DNA repair exonuclease SbcCD ATPase subunit/DNA repair exonuclease SbcCD nuclease subunit
MENKIAHISDLHIRFGSRHDEYKTVFNRLVKDLKEEKPRRIVIAGDIFHLKINLSPTSIEIAGALLRALSKIAPVDVIIGNHDFNEQDVTQGDAITPLIDLLENGCILNEPGEIPKGSKGNKVYFYKKSGFYQIDKDLIYGVYSMLDGEILRLTDKEEGKKYVALYHGPVYGCQNDNGYVMKGDELLKITAFNNFDIVILGDIHEFQSFERQNGDTAAYSGSLIQQNYGEGIEKGYLIWDISNDSFQRRFIPNDYGFCKLNITKGELIEERLEDLKFSLDKKKTRIYIELEDDAENENIERKSQIRRWIRDRHGCENVTVEFKPISKGKSLDGDLEEIDFDNNEDFEKLLHSYLTENSFENIEDVIELSREIDSKFSTDSAAKKGVDWELNKMETFNIFSHPAQVSIFDFDKLDGITGIFGKNYSGKSNLIKALVWGLYEKILGGGDNHKVVNMYTGNNKAWVRIYLTISGISYRIERSITVTAKKDGTTKASYSIKYEYLSGEGNWIAEESDRAAKEKKEFKKLVIDSIGTFDDFTKVCLQTQGGKDDYLSLQQQPKNDLIRKFFGLEVFDLKYEAANDRFKQIKSLQKHLGDPSEIEKEIERFRTAVKEDNEKLESLKVEKKSSEDQIEIHNNEILELTKKLQKIDPTTETSVESAQSKKKNLEMGIAESSGKIDILSEWVTKNFLKDIPEDLKNLDTGKLNKDIENLRANFQKDKVSYIEIEKWVKSNPKVEEQDLKPLEDAIDLERKVKSELENKLLIAKGEKCPTCKQVTKQSDPVAEQELISEISKSKEKIDSLQKQISECRSAASHNNKVDSETNKMDSLKNSLQANKNEIERLRLNLERFTQIESDLSHNDEVMGNTRELESQRKKKQDFENRLKDLDDQIYKLNANESKKKDNSETESEIESLRESIKEYKQVLLQVDSNIKTLIGNIRVNESNVDNFTDKINQIKESVRVYNKYSIYLQAVSRDGIPAQIIRRKLPIVNYKINSILSNVVNFRIDMYVKPNGDVQEVFYFSPNKEDALPLSMGSGSQKFVGSIAITDALHHVSCLMKPNMRVIDEGFGTLDDDKTADIGKVFAYLRNRYKNVLIITHRTEIKDFVDNIIQVSKSTSGLTNEQVESNPEAGVSQFSITY